MIECPLPRYWLCHIVISLLIAAVVAAGLWAFVGVLGVYAGLAIGGGFYAAREVVQWRSGLPFDWPGLIAPVGACLAASAFVFAAVM